VPLFPDELTGELPELLSPPDVFFAEPFFITSLRSFVAAVGVIMLRVTVSEMPPRFKYSETELNQKPVTGDFWLRGPGQELLNWAQTKISAGSRVSELILPVKTRFGKLGVEALELAVGLERARQMPELPALALVHRESLEQSSKPPFNKFHAEYFTGCDTVLEVGAGLGLDTIALAAVVRNVIALEPNVERASYVVENLRALGITNVQVHCKKFEDAADLIAQADGIFADPSRRKGGERVRNPDECAPAMNILLAASAGKRLMVKLSPTSAGYLLDTTQFHRCFVGNDFEARELIIKNEPGCDKMILLSSDGPRHELAVGESAINQPQAIARIPITDARYLFEPHPVILTALGGVRAVCARLGLALITSEHGYLGSAEALDNSAWVKGYEIIETVPFRIEKIQALIDKHLLTKDTAIKKREHRVSPEQLQRTLRWHAAALHEERLHASALLCIDSGKNQWCVLVKTV